MTLEQRLSSFAEAWKPKMGEKLIGRVVGLDERVSDYNPEPYPIVVVLTEDGQERSFHGFHTVARRELASQRPVVGDRIGIAYHGKHEEKGYEQYRIVVEHANPEPAKEPDWDAIGASAEAELAREPSDPANWAD